MIGATALGIVVGWIVAMNGAAALGGGSKMALLRVFGWNLFFFAALLWVCQLQLGWAGAVIAVTGGAGGMLLAVGFVALLQRQRLARADRQ
ncbi:MAG TPA: hypothetical protein VGW40_04195 [Allosphingosinicella sp.]|nr:hypothetical protein [Allosphingosinicella sp.]